MITYSIGIPAFKSLFLKECIDSVLAQTYANFELIIINDCSPNPVENIINSFNDPRIRYFKNDVNVGALNVIDNWNNCLNVAEGEFFILLGDDDKLLPTYLEEFNTLIDKYNTLDVYHCRSYIINEQSESIRITPINPEFEDIYDYITSCITSQREQFISDFVYRRSTLILNGGFYKLPLAWISDYLSSYIACGDKGIAHTNKIVFNYRVNSGNITSTGGMEHKREASIRYFSWIKSFLEGEPDDQDSLLKRITLERAYVKALRMEQINFIRQTIGKRSFLQGIYQCFKDREKYNITLNDFVASVLSSLNDKLLTKKSR